VRHQEILFGVAGQSFVYDPPEGRPTGTPTAQVFSTGTDDDGTAELATTGVCSVDAVATTLNGAIAAGATSAVLANGASVVRSRRYVLTDADGDQEQVEVIAVNGTAVAFRQPIVNDYATGSTFVGTRISISVDSTWSTSKSKLTDVLGEVWRTAQATPNDWAAGASGYRVRWTYSVNGTATLGVTYVDLVRYQAKNLVSPLDVDRRFPGWIDRLPTDYRRDQGTALIDEAFHAVRMDALADSELLRRVRDTQVLAELVRYRSNVCAAEASVLVNPAARDLLEVASQLYERRYKQLIREPKVPYDNTGGGSNGQAQRLPISRR
jgi:hypothetical protein